MQEAGPRSPAMHPQCTPNAPPHSASLVCTSGVMHITRTTTSIEAWTRTWWGGGRGECLGIWWIKGVHEIQGGRGCTCCNPPTSPPSAPTLSSPSSPPSPQRGGPSARPGARRWRRGPAPPPPQSAACRRPPACAQSGRPGCRGRTGPRACMGTPGCVVRAGGGERM